MKSLMGIRAIVVVGFVVMCSKLAYAGEPEINVVRINGYRVVIVDTKFGNQVRLSTIVPYGSISDRADVHAGRAHLLEHYVHRVTEKYPNATEYLGRLTARAAGSSNASTGGGYTNYFIYGHQDELPALSDFIGSIMTEMVRSEVDFVAEREVVIEEVTNYNTNSNTRALSYGLGLALFPEGHPLHTNLIGEAEGLRKITLDDMEDLFVNNYGPDNTNLIVVGNFSPEYGGAYSVRDVVEQIARSFIPSTAQLSGKLHAPALNRKSKDISIFPLPANDRFYELKPNGNERRMMLTFYLPKLTMKELDQLELLDGILFNRFEGGLSKHLIDNELVSSMGMGENAIHDAQSIQVVFDLTEKGSQQAYRVAEHFFAAVHQFMRDGVSEEFLQAVRLSAASSFPDQLRNPGEIASRIEQVILSGNNEVDLPHALDLYLGRSETSSVSELQDFARKIFDIDRLFVAYMAPEVVNDPSPLQVHPVYKRLYRTPQRAEILANWRQILSEGNSEFSVSFPEIGKSTNALSFVPQSETSNEIINLKTLDGDHLLLQPLNDRSGDIALRVNFDTRLLNIDEQIALLLMSAAFQKEYAHYFSLEKLRGSFRSGHLLRSSGQEGLVFTASGNYGSVTALLNDILGKYLAYEPTFDALRVERDKLATNLDRGIRTKQTASLAAGYLKALYNLDDASEISFLERLPEFDLSKVQAVVHSVLSRVDIFTSVVGDYSLSAQEELLKRLRLQLPFPLTHAERQLRDQSAQFELVESMRVRIPLPPSVEPGAYAIGQSTSRYPSSSVEGLSLIVMGNMISNRVSELNRSVKNLGYVHGAAVNPSFRDGVNLLMLGQTIDANRIHEIEEGFREVADGFVVNSALEEEYREAYLGTIRAFSHIPGTKAEIVNRIANRVRNGGTPEGMGPLLEGFANISPKSAIEAVSRVMLESPTLTVEATNLQLPCEGVFMHADFSKVQQVLFK